MAPRFALLSAWALLALAACGEERPARSGGVGCRDCHEPCAPGREACVACHRGDSRADRGEIAHHRLLTGLAAAFGLPGSSAVAAGRRWLDELACRRCHTATGTGNRLAADLDRVVWQRLQGDLVRAVAEPVEQMPAFGLETRQIEEIVAALLAAADPDLAEATYRIRFRVEEGESASVFEESCGGCHRALTAGGARGSSSVGPNLSGLLTPFYPPTAPGLRPWSEPTLRSWIDNPRALRPTATMRPVALEPEAYARLVAEIGGAPAP